MNQKSRQNAKNSSKKTFLSCYNFRYDCRNNLGNCQFIPIFDEMNEITHLKRCYNYFDEEVSKFVSSDLRAYSAIHNYDIICLSETYLNTTHYPTMTI